jgi:hypothetical protein
MREVVPLFGDGTVNDPGDTEGVKGTGNGLDMTDRDIGFVDDVNRSRQIRGLSGNTKILWFDNSNKGLG